jgi:hypothetical protein
MLEPTASTEKHRDLFPQYPNGEWMLLEFFS